MRLTELPAVTALVTEDKGGHRFISWSGLDLVVGTVVLSTLATLQHVSLGALDIKWWLLNVAMGDDYKNNKKQVSSANIRSTLLKNYKFGLNNSKLFNLAGKRKKWRDLLLYSGFKRQPFLNSYILYPIKATAIPNIKNILTENKHK